MRGCACSWSDDSVGPAPYTEKLVTARKDHQCCACRQPILKGQRYEYINGCWDGEWDRFKTCLACSELRNAFCCSSGLERIFEDITEMFLPDINPCCLDGLSARAIEKLETYLFPKIWPEYEQEAAA